MGTNSKIVEERRSRSEVHGQVLSCSGTICALVWGGFVGGFQAGYEQTEEFSQTGREVYEQSTYQEC